MNDPAVVALGEPPLIDHRKSFADVTAEVAAPTEKKPGMLWTVAFAVALLLVLQMGGRSAIR